MNTAGDERMSEYRYFDVAIPDIPSVTEVIIDGSKVTLKWEACDNAVKYNIQLCDDGWTTSQWFSTTDTFYTFNDLKDGLWRYRVGSENSKGYEKFDEYHSFTVGHEHNYGQWIVDMEATCTTEGSKYRMCQDCEKKETEIIEALGHIEMVDGAVEATCTQTGLTEGKHCSRCNEVLVNQETLKARGHDYNEWSIEAKATCENDGNQYRTCKNCESIERETLEKLGHKFSTWKTTVYPTCEDEGRERRVCEACDKVETRTLEAKGHGFDSGKTTKDATCTADGLKVYTCGTCGKTDTEIIEKYGHNYSAKWTVDKKATTTVNGSKSKHCTRCNSKTSVTTIYKASNVKLGTATYVYNGKMRSPSVVIKDSKGNVISSANYTLSKPTGRKNVGKYTYKITFKNQYSGTKSLTLTINPKGTSISSLTKAKKAFTVKWKKQATQTTGYQICYGTSTNKNNCKKVLVTSNKTLSKKITGLKSGKKYYVWVRTYKTVNGTKYYSAWSARKSVTTK